MRHLLLEASFDDVERVVDARPDPTADPPQKHVLPRRQLVPTEVRGQLRLEHLVAGEVDGLPAASTGYRKQNTAEKRGKGL